MTQYEEYHKAYYQIEENREKMRRYLTRKIVCECGKEISYVNMKKHKNTIAHKYRILERNQSS